MNDAIHRVKQAILALKKGEMVILLDHESRENEADLILAAEHITPEKMNFMIKNTSGIVCLSLPSHKIKQLNLHDMVAKSDNHSSQGTPFTVSIEARQGVTTGVSAKDRTKTILAAIQENASQADIVKPGHVFPLHARKGGVLERQGHTEGSLDLVTLSGLTEAAVLCELMDGEGNMLKGKEAQQFALDHQLPIVSIEDLIIYRRYHENLISEKISTSIPLNGYGQFCLSVLREKWQVKEHIVLTKPQISDQLPLIRIHSSCTTGDLFGSLKCDCQAQLQYSLQRISEEGGALIYLNQEGRDIGLFNKIKAYQLQEEGLDTVEANLKLNLPIDAREYYIAANWLRENNIHEFRLLSNNPSKIENLKKYGCFSIDREALPAFMTEENQKYLHTKQKKMNHFINDEPIGM